MPVFIYRFSVIIRGSIPRIGDNHPRFGEGQPYGRSEIAKVRDVPVITGIAHDPQTAIHFSDGTPRHRRFDSSPLTRSIRDASFHLSTTMQQAAELVGGRS